MDDRNKNTKCVAVLRDVSGTIFTLPKEIALLYWLELSEDMKRWLEQKEQTLATLIKRGKATVFYGNFIAALIGVGAYFFLKFSTDSQSLGLTGVVFATCLALVSCVYGYKCYVKVKETKKNRFESPIKKISLLKHSFTVVPFSSSVLFVDDDGLSPKFNISYQ